MLTALTFLAFGAILLPAGLEHATGRAVLLAIALLTVLRMLPICLAPLGTDLTTCERVFLGWFGPRGLASIIFALLVLEHLDFAASEEMLPCVSLTIALRVLLHRLSAGPMAARFAAQPASKPTPPS
jgi:NhaP-type Na+/H+ or K+/H+ antiporter